MSKKLLFFLLVFSFAFGIRAEMAEMGEEEMAETGDSEMAETGDGETAETGDGETAETGDGETVETVDDEMGEKNDTETAEIDDGEMAEIGVDEMADYDNLNLTLNGTDEFDDATNTTESDTDEMDAEDEAKPEVKIASEDELVSEDDSPLVEEEPEDSTGGKIVEDETSDDVEVDEMSKKSVKNFTCKVTGAILSMAESIKELTNELKDIKTQVFEKCPGFSGNKTDSLDLEDSDDASNTTDDKTKVEQNIEEGEKEEEKDVLPPIPTECDAPFQPVANSCYYFLYYPPDWKTWGDANAYCQTFGGTLAAPYRYEDLRIYLQENFSNVFWVGAKKSTTKKDTYEWLTGKELIEDDWKKGQPSKSAAKFCVYLESFSGYKAINHYCGEKFSFVCEKRVEVE